MAYTQQPMCVCYKALATQKDLPLSIGPAQKR